MRPVDADPSTGDGKRIYNTAIQVESEVLKLIAPKGTTDQVHQAIVATSVDVISLPGKSTNASAVDNGIVMDQFVKAVGDLNNLNSRRIGSVPRDSQWKMNSRNALDKIKTLKELMENTDELLQSVEEIVSNMEMAIKDILLASGWTLTSAETY
jgi:L-lysine 2,3-aminomutase